MLRFLNWETLGATELGKSQFILSPRVQISFLPNWEKDLLFQMSGGIYYQPPFYRELRDSNGQVQPNVKAQQSIHYVVANDYNLKMWNSQFKLVLQFYYKSMSNVNLYTIDNVRIRYAVDNFAKAYAQGIDFRLNAEFVPGTE